MTWEGWWGRGRRSRLGLLVGAAVTTAGLSFAIAASAGFDEGGRGVLPLDRSIQSVVAYPGGGAVLVIPYGGVDVSAEGLYRLLPDGSIDASFGKDGFVERYVSDIAVQADGKILVLAPTGPDFASAVTRLLPSGSVDPSFGHEGEVRVPLSSRGELEEALAIALSPNGRIVVSGKASKAHDPTSTRPAMALLNADGSPDRSFGGDGVITPGFPTYPPPAFGPVGIAPDGTIIAIVYAGLHARWQRMVRIESDGTLDRSFGKRNGYTVVGGLRARPPVFPPLEQIDVLRDGRIVVGGTVSRYLGHGQSVYWGVLMRWLPSGLRDRRYGGDGIVRTPFKKTFFPAAVSVSENGSAVLAGDLQPTDADSNLAIVAFTANGEPDTRFGRRGVSSVDFGLYENAYGMALQPDGSVFAVGETTDGAGRRETVIARFERHLPH